MALRVAQLICRQKRCYLIMLLCSALLLATYLLLAEPRMKLLQRPPQKAAIQVGVNFGCGDAFMSQHFLHGP
jgi:hypothetical protein